MTDTCFWKGVSGQSYNFSVFPRGTKIQSGVMGNYIYARKNIQGYWVPVYIGQGDLSIRANDNHHRIDCIDQKGATHVHLLGNQVEKDRFAVERDLLGYFTNAYAPSGCNIKVGG
jgi:hypothetical protein